jgi:hypothetical protein
MLNRHHLTGTPESDLSTAAHYWYSTFPTSRLRIPIQVAAGGVGIYYLKESAKDVGDGSAVECWVDDNYSGAKFLENVASGVESVPTYVLSFCYLLSQPLKRLFCIDLG